MAGSLRTASRDLRLAPGGPGRVVIRGDTEHAGVGTRPSWSASLTPDGGGNGPA